MALPEQITTREYQKFEDAGLNKTAVRVTGTSRPTGLIIGGKITEVTLSDSSWTALPPVALAERNQLNIQNETAFNIKIRYENTEPSYKGVTIASGSERQYAISDSIIIFAKLEPGGSGAILVEELA